MRVSPEIRKIAAFLSTPSRIEPLGKQLIVVKSNQHFHQGFAPVAGKIIYLMTPGTTDRNMAAIPYKTRSLNYWPRVENPFAD